MPLIWTQTAISASPITYVLGDAPHQYTMTHASHPWVYLLPTFERLKWVLVITKSSNFHGEVSSMNQIWSFQEIDLPIKYQQLCLCMYDRHGRYHWDRTHILFSLFGNTHHTTYSLMQSSIASQTPNDYSQNNLTGMRPCDLIRYLNKLPHLCNFSLIIGKITVCICGCLLASAHLQDTLPATSQGGATTFLFQTGRS